MYVRHVLYSAVRCSDTIRIDCGTDTMCVCVCRYLRLIVCVCFSIEGSEKRQGNGNKSTRMYVLLSSSDRPVNLLHSPLAWSAVRPPPVPVIALVLFVLLVRVYFSSPAKLN